MTRRALLVLLVVAASTRARAETNVHFDVYMLGVSRADLRHAPLLSNDDQPMSAAALGLDHMTSFEFTPYVAPHFGLGVETWRWLFYAEGLFAAWGVDNTGGSAQDLVLSFESAPRWDLGAHTMFSVGPSAGVRWLSGETWHTGPRPMVGGDAELRFHVEGKASRKHGGANMSWDFFLRLSCTFVDGPAWMLSFGEGFGSMRAEPPR